MIKANIEEDLEVTMVRFIDGLNKEITNVVELYHYVEMEDMVSIDMKMKKQQKHKVAKVFSTSNSKWSSKWPKYEEIKNKGSDSKEKGLDTIRK